MRSNRLLVLLVGVALAACAAPSTVTPRRAAGQSPVPSASGSVPIGVAATATPGTGTPAPTAGPTGTPTGPTPTATAGVSATAGIILTGRVASLPGLIGDQGGSILSNNGASVISDQGSGLIGDQGGGIISNNGGGIIGNNGGSLAGGAPAFRLLADEVPQAGVRVFVLDAQGHPLVGADKQPIFATTDAQGKYAFRGVLPAHDLVLAVGLADGKGRLQGLVGQDGTGIRQVDLDLVGSLVAGYVLDRYVATQADRQATLDRLPTAMEADTRARVQAALKASAAVPPPDLQAATVLPLVEQLRGKDPALDAQLELVRKTLIPVGLLDQGNGKPATQVQLGVLGNLSVGQDGTLYLAGAGDNRLWTVDAAGNLVGLAGTGLGDDLVDGLPEGKDVPATTTALQGPRAVVPLGGKVYVLTSHHWGYSQVVRLNGDGTMRLVWRDNTGAAWRAGNHGLRNFNGMIADAKGRLVLADFTGLATLDPATGTLQPLQSVNTDAWLRGVDASGAFYIWRSLVANEIDRVAPQATIQTTAVAHDLTWPGLAVAQEGTIYKLQNGTLSALHPDGTTTALAPTAATIQAAKLGAFDLAATAPDGSLYLAASGSGRFDPVLGGDVPTPIQVWRIKGATVTLVAGTDGGQVPTNANTLSLQLPHGLAFGADGALFVSDYLAGKIFKVQGLNTVAATYPIDQPGILRLATDGAIYALCGGDGTSPGSRVLRRLAKDGTVSTILSCSDTHLQAEDYLVTPDGRIALLAGNDTTQKLQLLLLDPATGERTLLTDLDAYTDPSFSPVAAMVRAPDGSYVIGVEGRPSLNDGHILRFTPGAGVTTVVPKIYLWLQLGATLDPKGAFIDASFNTITRIDLTSGFASAIVGSPSKVLAGSGVDDSLSQPYEPTFAPNGDLYLADSQHKQIKRVTADQLP